MAWEYLRLLQLQHPAKPVKTLMVFPLSECCASPLASNEEKRPAKQFAVGMHAKMLGAQASSGFGCLLAPGNTRRTARKSSSTSRQQTLQCQFELHLTLAPCITACHRALVTSPPWSFFHKQHGNEAKIHLGCSSSFDLRDNPVVISWYLLIMAVTINHCWLKTIKTPFK